MVRVAGEFFVALQLHVALRVPEAGGEQTVLGLDHRADAGDVPEGADQRIGNVFGRHVNATGVVNQVDRGPAALGRKMERVRHGLGVGL